MNSFKRKKHYQCQKPTFLPARFSPAQAELYEAVLEVQRSCLSVCSPGVSLDHIYSTMLALLGRQLKRLGIVKAGTSDADALKVTVQATEVQLAALCTCVCVRIKIRPWKQKSIFFTNNLDCCTHKHNILCFNISHINLSTALSRTSADHDRDKLIRLSPPLTISAWHWIQILTDIFMSSNVVCRQEIAINSSSQCKRWNDPITTPHETQYSFIALHNKPSVVLFKEMKQADPTRSYCICTLLPSKEVLQAFY